MDAPKGLFEAVSVGDEGESAGGDNSSENDSATDDRDVVKGDDSDDDDNDDNGDVGTEQDSEPYDAGDDDDNNDDNDNDVELPDAADEDIEESDDIEDSGYEDDAESDAGDNADDDDATPPLEETEFRGVWVTRWDYKSKADVERIMDDVAGAGFNAVMWQVRGVADAYYRSNYEPWASGLSGTLGKDPGWDPLAVAVEEAKERGLEIHAWLNTFTAWSGSNPPSASSPPHILYEHPEYRQADTSGTPMPFGGSGYVFVSPGIPEVQQHIINVVLDIAENYDIDGIHFDYIRYAGAQYSHDAISKARYEEAKAKTPSLTFEDWQRNELTNFVANAYAELIALRPSLVVSAAVWGIYKEVFGWGGTSQGFYDYYQDSHRWVQEGIIDVICPMIYWRMTNPKGGWTDFATLVDDFIAKSGERFIYPGINGDLGISEIKKQIEYTREAPTYGNVIFAYSYLFEGDFFDDLLSSVYSEPAPTPPMNWKPKK
ncbi:MAG: hypothetical protein Kow0090_17740 [Myxococcota bacterium]